MSASLRDLIAVLERKDRMMSELTDALCAEERSVVELDMKGLEESLQRKETLLSQLAEAKFICTAHLSRAGRELKLGENPSLRAVAEAAPDEEGRRLLELRARLEEKGKRLELLLRQNGSLVNRSLEFIDTSMKLFSRLLKGPQTYGASGRIVAAAGGAAIVCREI